MSWLKVSDAFTMHPMLLQVLEFGEYADDRIVNEMAGFLTRCAASAAAYETDYVIAQGMIQTIAGSFQRNKVLVYLATKIGIFTEMRDPKGRTVYKLIEEEDLFHMILKAERAWKNRQKQDNRNPKLTAPVRKRDGDECRWCGNIVNWNDRRSGRGGTYDHLNPGQGAASPEEMVVCCFSCNAQRRDAVGWDKTLRPVPEAPYYSSLTVSFLEKYNIHVKPTDSLDIDIEDAQPKDSLTPVVETTESVERAAVESASVETTQQAPEATTPKATAPDSAQAPTSSETFTCSFDDLDGDLAEAPQWVREEVETNRVETKQQAPWSQAPSKKKPNREHLVGSGRFRQISTVTDLDLSGRVGTGKRSTSPQENSPAPGNSSTGKPKRRRGRRGKGKKND